MKTVIYGDIYFIINFSMDFTALFVTAKIIKVPIRLFRFCIAASLGAVYAIGSLFLHNAMLSVFMSVLVPALMCIIAIGGKGKARESLVGCALFFGVSFLMGGMISAVYLLVNEYLIGRGIYINGRLDMIYSDLPLWSLALLAAISAAISSVIGKISKKRSISKRGRVILEDGIKRVEFTALYDSGNLLCDPISSLPVIVVSKRIAKEIFPRKVYEAAEKNDICAVDAKYMKKVRIIPISTVSGEGMLIAYIPESALVLGKSRRVCIALDKSAKSEGAFDGCEGIIPAELF